MSHRSMRAPGSAGRAAPAGRPPDTRRTRAGALARRVASFGAAGLTLAAAGYGASTAGAWRRYGRPRPPSPDEIDDLLDRFMPEYDIVERHQIRVQAPADVTLAAAREQDMLARPIVRALFKVRELAMGGAADGQARPRALLPQVLSLGWTVLADVPGREIVVGAVTRPWVANVVFRGIPAASFAAFDEPEYVKIVWTLRADPAGPDACVFRTETRAVPTDAAARVRFRRYWSLVSPGIALIRRLSLASLAADAERRFRQQRSTADVAER